MRDRREARRSKEGRDGWCFDEKRCSERNVQSWCCAGRKDERLVGEWKGESPGLKQGMARACVLVCVQAHSSIIQSIPLTALTHSVSSLQGRQFRGGRFEARVDRSTSSKEWRIMLPMGIPDRR